MSIRLAVLLLFVHTLSPAFGQKKLAVVIGIAGYPGFPEGERLKFAGDDAASFAKFIETPAGGNFQAQNVHVLTNQTADRTGIYNEFNWLYEEAGPNDTVYVFFAGHGTEFRGVYYFLPYGASKEEPDALGIPMTEFYRKVTRDLAAKQIVVFVDACHAAMAQEGRSSGSIDIEKEWDQQSQKAGQIAMALFSSLGNERSWEDPSLGGGHGLFTWYLLEGLKGQAPRTPEGFITADNLWNYVRDKVVDRSKKQFPEQQTPIASSQFRADLPLAYVGSPAGDLANRNNTSVGELIRQLKNANESEKEQLKAKLVAMGPSIANSVLHSDIGDDVALKMELGAVLGGLGQAAVPAMIEALRDPNHFTRSLAAWGFIEAPNRQAVPALLRAFSEAHSAGEINDIATALTWEKDNSEIEPMIRWVKDDSDGFHYWNAANVLASIGSPAVAAVPALISALNNQERIDWSICDALGSIGDDRAVPALANHLQAGADNQTIMRNLVKFGPRAAPVVPQLLRNAGSGPYSTLGVLEGIGDAAIPNLIDGLSDRNSRVRELAAKALGNMGLTPQATIALKKIVADPTEAPYVISAATAALNGIRQQ
jgi:HEAT repeat protein